jgi:phosphoesterase RecJ-like protein
MDGMKRNPEAVAEAIRKAQTIAVISHVNPDGDTLGCATAMRLGLLALGKDVTLFCDGKIPDIMSFLPGADLFRRPEENEGPFDLMLSVDVSDVKRLGACEALRKASRMTAQIDHHPTNPLFMEINSVDGEAPAACLMIREQLKALGVPLTKEIAECLYAGISTDTGNFAFSATNSECFQVMSELMETGLPLAQLNRILFRVKPREQMKLLGRALESMRFAGNGNMIAVMKLTREDFEDCGALSEHADTVVNYGLDTVGTEMAVLAREGADGKIKFSLRAKEPQRIDDVAQKFGGGGHPQASGITMDGSLDETLELVLAEMVKKI